MRLKKKKRSRNKLRKQRCQLHQPKLHINIPFAEAMEQMPSYAKFMKELLSKKRKLVDLATKESCSQIYDQSTHENLVETNKAKAVCSSNGREGRFELMHCPDRSGWPLLLGFEHALLLSIQWMLPGLMVIGAAGGGSDPCCGWRRWLTDLDRCCRLVDGRPWLLDLDLGFRICSWLVRLLESSDGGSESPQVGTIAGHGSSTMANTACPVRGLPILVVDQALSDLLALCPLLEGETAADAAVDNGPPVCTWMWFERAAMEDPWGEDGAPVFGAPMSEDTPFSSIRAAHGLGRVCLYATRHRPCLSRHNTVRPCNLLEFRSETRHRSCFSG
ncbi:hypothetical protein ACLOJK_038368 [Asimina triloba]